VTTGCTVIACFCCYSVKRVFFVHCRSDVLIVLFCHTSCIVCDVVGLCWSDFWHFIAHRRQPLTQRGRCWSQIFLSVYCYFSFTVDVGAWESVTRGFHGCLKSLNEFFHHFSRHRKWFWSLKLLENGSRRSLKVREFNFYLECFFIHSSSTTFIIIKCLCNWRLVVVLLFAFLQLRFNCGPKSLPAFERSFENVLYKLTLNLLWKYLEKQVEVLEKFLNFVSLNEWEPWLQGVIQGGSGFAGFPISGMTFLCPYMTSTHGMAYIRKWNSDDSFSAVHFTFRCRIFIGFGRVWKRELWWLAYLASALQVEEPTHCDKRPLASSFSKLPLPLVTASLYTVHSYSLWKFVVLSGN